MLIQAPATEVDSAVTRTLVSIVILLSPSTNRGWGGKNSRLSNLRFERGMEEGVEYLGLNHLAALAKPGRSSRVFGSLLSISSRPRLPARRHICH